MKRIIFLLIAVTAILTACQPTPESTVIADKSESIIETVEQADAEQITESQQVIEEQIKTINQHLNMEFTPSQRTKIIVDAEIYIPTYETIPLIRVVPNNFSTEHLENMIDSIVGDEPVYKSTCQEDFYVKEDIEALIPVLKQYAQNQNLPDHVKKYLDQIITIYEEKYFTAKTMDERVLFDGTLDEVTNRTNVKTSTQLITYMGKNVPAWIGFEQSDNNLTTYMSYDNYNFGGSYNTLEPYKGIDAPKIDKSYEECKAIAEEVIKDIDGVQSNMKLADSKIAYCIGHFSDYTKETSPQAYVFTFAREFNGALVKYIQPLMSGPGNVINYSQQIVPERLCIIIDNDGVASLMWENHTVFQEVVSDNVPLIGFDSIQKIFSDYMKYKYSWEPHMDSVPKDATSTITIHTVELNLMMTPEKDNIGNYIMIPVWDFIGDMEYDQEIITQEGYEQDGEYNVAILTINAIDGSVIDREQGY